MQQNITFSLFTGIKIVPLIKRELEEIVCLQGIRTAVRAVKTNFLRSHFPNDFIAEKGIFGVEFCGCEQSGTPMG